jgi:hypothetical protein
MVGPVARYRYADASCSGVRRAAAARKTSTARKDKRVAADLDGIFNRLAQWCRVGPGNFTPSRSQIRTSRWVPPLPVDPVQRGGPSRSTGITPLHHYYGAVRPYPAHRYFRPRGCSHLSLFPWHHGIGSHVPYRSPVEIRATDCRMPLGRSQASPKLIPKVGPTLGFDTSNVTVRV